MTDWSIARSRKLYNVSQWGSGYFDINELGHVVARPDRASPETVVDLHELSEMLDRHGMSSPVLVRFGGILKDRVQALYSAFSVAAGRCGFQGAYAPVYPIKVNQQRCVVTDLLDRSAGRVGLEAGSKPELLAALGMAPVDGAPIICNGYKDSEYIRIALIASRLGHRCYIVIEKPDELGQVLHEAAKLGVQPLIGIRARLASIGKGKWQNTGGEKSKFGLTAAQMLSAVALLREHGQLDCLQLLHAHLGSQVANIHDIQCGMGEVARFYAELRRLGAPVTTVDVGGGLGVDYEGTRSRSFCSMNYSVDEYAHKVVQAVADICRVDGLPHPDIITEAGRAMVADHAVLITDVIGSESPAQDDHAEPGDTGPAFPAIQHLEESLSSLTQRSAVEVFHDAVHWMAQAQEAFVHGLLTLDQRAYAERLYFRICGRVRPLLKDGAQSQRQVSDELREKVADKYFCNMSIFQSLPDIWAIEQIFPIVPLHRLDEEPCHRAVLSDITCDSDGRIDLYVGEHGIESTLPLHDVREGERYLVGIFLVGAYQEILGDMHNLFGDTHSVNIEPDEAGGYRITNPRPGETVEDVLRHVQYERGALIETYRGRVAAAGLDEAQAAVCLETLISGLSGYTYLEE